MTKELSLLFYPLPFLIEKMWSTSSLSLRKLEQIHASLVRNCNLLATALVVVVEGGTLLSTKRLQVFCRSLDGNHKKMLFHFEIFVPKKRILAKVREEGCCTTAVGFLRFLDTIPALEAGIMIKCPPSHPLISSRISQHQLNILCSS